MTFKHFLNHYKSLLIVGAIFIFSLFIVGQVLAACYYYPPEECSWKRTCAKGCGDVWETIWGCGTANRRTPGWTCAEGCGVGWGCGNICNFLGCERKCGWVTGCGEVCGWAGRGRSEICGPVTGYAYMCGSICNVRRVCHTPPSQFVGECRSGQTQYQSCGNCGYRTRSCRNNCSWSSWSSCRGQGSCSPGQTQYRVCGNCGFQTRTCTGGCSWSGWSSCIGQGSCSPGQTQTIPCGDCGTQTRSCANSCSWSSWGSCTGQGCSPGQTQTRPCGNGGTQTRSCANSCSWSSWGSCQGERSCSPGQTQTIPCGDCGTQTNTCNAGGNWSGWGACTGEGSCSPGDTQACGSGGTQTCTASCDWGSCQGEVNRPPQVDAGDDKTVNEGESTTFNDNSALDPEGDPIVWQAWECINSNGDNTGGFNNSGGSNPVNSLSSVIIHPTYFAPVVDENTSLTCTYAAADRGSSDYNQDSFTLTVLDLGVSVCGDGKLDPGEECDNGASNNDNGSCTTQCKRQWFWWEAVPYSGSLFKALLNLIK